MDGRDGRDRQGFASEKLSIQVRVVFGNWFDKGGSILEKKKTKNKSKKNKKSLHRSKRLWLNGRIVKI
jgi:hypothetical protein